MVEAKSRVKCGITVASTLRIKEDRTVGANENVLRADISVNESDLSCLGKANECAYWRGQIRVLSGYLQKIWIETKLQEVLIIRKVAPDLFSMCGSSMNPNNCLADGCCKSRRHSASH